MDSRHQWSLKGTIVVLGILLPTLLVGVLLKFYIDDSRSQTLITVTDKARKICLMAEAFRESMEEKWAVGLFDVEQLRRFKERGETKKILEAVPVYSSLMAMSRKAEAAGYQFRVPKEHPRDPKNEPDERERRILDHMRVNNLEEYSEVDAERNAVRYFRAVRLSGTCMICHGDPATSPSLWGNDEGRDVVGGPMENWKVGEMHGAFEIIQDLGPSERQLEANIRQALWITLAGLVLMGVFFSTLVLRFVTRVLIRPVRSVIRHIEEGSENLRIAAIEVSRASHEVASGAANQAASVEQSAAALEQVAAMTQANSENVAQANDAAERVNESVDKAHERIENMVATMRNIQRASDQTATIVKTIDEIAFQTNLLSLNASIEAARAGEAGAGFSIVAEEVRMLAARSAAAAKETTDLITKGRQRAHEGVQVADQVKEILDSIMTDATHMRHLAREIATASREQAEGVAQVNVGVSEVDKVVQANAAVSEQVASASEELSSQASQLKDTVATLARVIR